MTYPIICRSAIVTSADDNSWDPSCESNCLVPMTTWYSTLLGRRCPAVRCNRTLASFLGGSILSASPSSPSCFSSSSPTTAVRFMRYSFRERSYSIPNEQNVKRARCLSRPAVWTRAGVANSVNVCYSSSTFAGYVITSACMLSTRTGHSV